MKKTLALLLTILSFNLLASGYGMFCDHSRGLVGGTLFYKNFLAQSSNYDYTFFFQDVDSELKKHLDATCTGAPMSEEEKIELIDAQADICNTACSAKAPQFARDIRAGEVFRINIPFLQKRFIKKLVVHCQDICDTTYIQQAEEINEIE